VMVSARPASSSGTVAPNCKRPINHQ
jgi:hypothetical protein